MSRSPISKILSFRHGERQVARAHALLLTMTPVHEEGMGNSQWNKLHWRCSGAEARKSRN
eukprot:2438626-Amphidinium_carterae.1